MSQIHILGALILFLIAVIIFSEWSFRQAMDESIKALHERNWIARQTLKSHQQYVEWRKTQTQRTIVDWVKDIQEIGKLLENQKPKPEQSVTI